MANFVQKYPTSQQQAGLTQTIAYTGSSVSATNKFGSETYQVRLVSDSACQYKIGDGAQTAAQDNTSPFLPANWVEYVRVNPGQQIAAIRAATDGLVTATSGTLWVTELS
jgi:hypothetical protein